MATMLFSLAVGSFLSFSTPVSNAQTEATTPNAEPQSEASEPEIIVEEPATLRERRNELRRMTRDVLHKPRFTQAIGTYTEPMCPKVFGLPEEAASVIEARMRANAIEFGLNHKNFPEKCKHNTSVIFVASSRGPADTWFTYDSDALDHLLSYERQRVLDEVGPVRAWTYRIERAIGPVNVPTGTGTGNDRLAFSRATQKDFYATRLQKDPNPLGGAAVLIEVAEADGKSLIQLADYASMRTFGNSKGISPDAVPAAPTILTLFQDGEGPEELTTFDKSLLTMLYSTPERASRTRFYGNISRSAARQEREDGAIEGSP